MSSSGSLRKSILFVCLGNICRSPMAEAVFLDLLNKRGGLDQWEVDSAATGDYWIGGGPEERCMSVLKSKGITTYNHVVRRLRTEDFNRFDYIFGMDDSNIRNIKAAAPASYKAKIELLGSYDSTNKSKQIRDPYYDSGDKGFRDCYENCVRACSSFLDGLN